MSAPAGQTVSIEKLTLHVPAMSEREARELVQSVARALRRWPGLPAAGGPIERVQANVTSSPTAGPERLAEQIAAAVFRAAARGADR